MRDYIRAFIQLAASLSADSLHPLYNTHTGQALSMSGELFF